MCSIVKIKGVSSSIFSSEVLSDVYTALKIKGGDEYGLCIYYEAADAFSMFDHETTVSILTGHKSNDKKKKPLYNSNVAVQALFFSRLTPETQKVNDTTLQPYMNLKSNQCVAVHGTIPNYNKIATKYKCKVDTDTQIFQFLKIEDALQETCDAGGKFSAISIGRDAIQSTNGLGIYIYNLSSLSFTTNINFDELKENLIHRFPPFKKVKFLEYEESKKVNIISLFSGGLDITCSTQKVLLKYPSANTHLWYFDWDTAAASSEIKAGRAFSKVIDASYKVFKIKDIFSNILEVCNIKETRLQNKKAKEVKTENETAISYVPYRNTTLLTLAAARAEQMFPNETCIFVLGANLTEGMVYLDNSETFITSMNDVIKVGGQKSSNFFVEAPYVNRTKTEMIKDANSLEFNLDHIFSCYFPIKGKACGKCGSCKLLEVSTKRANQ